MVSRREGVTVTVKVRFADFQTVTRSRTVAPAVDTGPAVATVATEHHGQIDPQPGVRLLGVSASNLIGRPARQLTFADAEAPWGDASEAVDEVRRRFGAASVGPASLVGAEGLQVKKRGDQQWGPG